MALCSGDVSGGRATLWTCLMLIKAAAVSMRCRHGWASGSADAVARSLREASL